MLESEGVDRLVAQILDSPLVDATVARVLASDELWLVVDEIARSPSVTEAISHQGVGFADQIAGEVGQRSRGVDDRLERAARRLLHRRPRPGDGAAPADRRRRADELRRARHGRTRTGAPAPPRSRPTTEADRRAYVGLVTRALAFGIDARDHQRRRDRRRRRRRAHLLGRQPSRTSSRRSRSPSGGVAYLLWGIGYFVTFWSTTGQTPGNRVFRIRVRGAHGEERLLPRRALLRFVGLTLAAIPLFAGFLIILVDDRRRGLQDRLARTVVVDAERRLALQPDRPSARRRR